MPPEPDLVVDDNYFRAEDVLDPFQAEGGEDENDPQLSARVQAAARATQELHHQECQISYRELQDDHAMIFEPRTFGQCFKSTFQNTVEVVQLCLIYLSAQTNPSLVSATFVMLAHIPVFFVTMKPRIRVEVTFYVNIFLMLLLGAVTTLKILQLDDKYPTCDEPQRTFYMRLFKGLGFSPKNKTNPKWLKNATCKDPQYVKVTGDFFIVIDFEIGAAIAFTMGMIVINERRLRVRSLDPNTTNGKNKLARLLLYKSFFDDAYYTESSDIKKDFDDEADKNKKAAKKEAYDKYNEFMYMYDDHDHLRVYLGSYHFQGKSTSYFFWIILLNLMQAVSRNGLIDVPGLFFILTLVSVSVIRKRFPIFYGFYCLAITYFYAFLVFVKVIHELCLDISFIKKNIAENFQHKSTKLMIVAFGVDVKANQTDLSARSIFEPTVLVYRLSLLLLMYTVHCYRAAKWAQILEKTDFLRMVEEYQREQGDENPRQYSSLEKAHIFFQYKDVLITFNDRTEFFRQQFDTVKNLKLGGGKAVKFDDIMRSIRKKSKPKQIDKKDRFTQWILSFEEKIPSLIKFGIKFGLLIQAYMYHSALGMLHLFFFLISFVIADRVFFYLCAIIILPIYLWEYSIVYLSQTDLLKKYVKEHAKYFVDDMENPILEQLLYLFVLLQLFMSVSCLMISYQSDTVESLKDFFRMKIKEKRGFSIVFKMIFLMLKYMYLIVLLFLFFTTSAQQSESTTLRSLGMNIFFTLYLSSEELYRKSNWVLSLFIAMFIIGQYYFALTWYRYYDDKILMEKLAWMNLYKNQSIDYLVHDHKGKQAQWGVGSPVYFRHWPYFMDYFIIFMLASLNLIDQMYLDDQNDDQKLTRECQRRVADDYPKISIFLIKLQERSQFFLIIFLFLFVGYSLVNLQVCLISWLFFILLVLIFSNIGRLDNKDSTLHNIVILSKLFKFLACFIIVAEVIFVTLFGAKKNDSTYDEWFRKHHSLLYQQLDSIGFRWKIDYKLQHQNATKAAEMNDQYFADKRRTYLVFLIISMFLTSYFQSAKEANQKRRTKREEEWAQLFNFEMKHQRPVEGDPENVEEELLEEAQRKSMTATGINRSSTLRSTQANADKEEEYLKLRQEQRTEVDIIEQIEYEKVTRQYSSYRLMDWWPTLDFLALYGQVISCTINVFSAVFVSTSLFSMINLAILCVYFYTATSSSFKSVKQLRAEVGVLKQADLHFARKVTNDYTNLANFQFIKIRKVLWKVQMGLVTTLFIIGYPTSIINRVRQHSFYNAKNNKTHTVIVDYKKMDTTIFWLNFIGIYHDEGENHHGTYFIPFFMMYIALFFERLCILWLQDRFGCGYKEIQKYAELETRHEFVMAQVGRSSVPWKATKSIPYNIESYKQFIYTSVPNDLEERFTETGKEALDNKKQFKKSDNKMRDYMDTFTAVALRDAIRFQVRLTGLCPEIVTDEETNMKKPLCPDTIEGLRTLSHPAIDLLDIAKDNTLDLEQDDEQKKQESDEEIDIDNYPGIYECASDPDAYRESIPVIREYKEAQLRKNLIFFIDFKYRMSFNKGMKMLHEACILLIMMISVIVKANVFSIFYLLFVLKYITSSNKLELIVKIVKYTVIFIFLQYLMALINLNHESAAQKFPSQFKNYPKTVIPEYAVPVFFHFSVFRENLRLCYLLGISLQSTQVRAMIIDFLFLYFSVMYILKYGNPLLQETDKLFWQYPKNYDPPKKWARLTDDVYAQVKWLNRLTTHKDQRYENVFSSLSEKQQKIFEEQYEHGLEYRKTVNVHDLEKQLVTFVDLSCKQIVSQDYIRQKKMELKRQSNYYRLVKQGSLLVYLTFHMLTITIVLVASTVRQSLIGFLYVLVILPHLKSAAEVLSQRLFAQNAKRTDLEEYIADLETELEPVEEEIKDKEQEIADAKTELIEEENQFDHDIEQVKEMKVKIDELRGELAIIMDQRKIIEKKLHDSRAERKNFEIDRSKSPEEREADEQLMRKYNEQAKWFFCVKRRAEGEEIDPRTKWTVVNVLSIQLVFIAFTDFCFQIIIQMPVIPYSKSFSTNLGIRKIWHNDAKFNGTYEEIINPNIKFEALQFDSTNFFIQCLTCYIITILLMQKEIFFSYGYSKFITQKDGSMDLLVQLASDKAKALTFAFNNSKVKKIVKIQSDREKIIQVANKVRQHLINWRKWTQSVLNPNYAMIVQEIEKETQMIEEKKEREANKKNRKRQIDQQVHQKQETQKTTTQTNKTTMTEQIDNEANNKIQEKRLPPELVNPYFKELTQQFVESKKEKLSCCAGFYLFLQRNFVNQLLILQDKEEIDFYVDETFAKQGVAFPCELERMMLVEADELIRNEFESRDGLRELNNLIKKSQSEFTQQKSLLDITGIDKTIKLKHMEQTMAFTRFCSLMEKIFVETIFQIMLSSADNLAYLAMIFSMYVNAGLCSIIYPIAVFGYALLEETRPRRFFWRWMLWYTVFLLLVKFTWNLKILEKLTQGPGYMSIAGWVHPGLRKYHTLVELTFYIVPELLIVFFITLNEIRLQMLGLFYQIEEDIEILPDAFTRTVNKGAIDENLVEEMKLQRNNMAMDMIFRSREDQEIDEKNAKQEAIEAKKKFNQQQADLDIMIKDFKKDELDELEDDKPKTQKELAQAQIDLFSNLGSKVQLNSKQFFIDIGSKPDNMKIDTVKQSTLLMKQLESDLVLFVEGHEIGSVAQNELQIIGHGFQDIGRSLTDVKDKVPLVNQIKIGDEDDPENISACDFEEDFDQKRAYLDEKEQPIPSMFESIPYFVRLFPTLKQQKPGVDWYLSSTVTLVILFVYTMSMFKKMTINEDALLKGAAKANNIFKGQMAIMMIIIIIIIVLERYINRSDTKKTKNLELEQDNQEEKTYYSQSEVFAKSKNTMTVKVQQTQRTAVMDVTSDSAQEYLKKLTGQNDDNEVYEGLDNSENQTNITKQQVCKYILHWIIIFYVLVHIFWYLPIDGNLKLYSKAYCPSHEGQKNNVYGCMDFQDNWAFKVYFWIWCLYIYCSSQQIRYGLPIKKIASSITELKSDLNPLPMQIYDPIPFAIEIRCILDFIFSKTALDPFQHWQCYGYLRDCYLTKWGNMLYTEKVLGSEITGWDPMSRVIGFVCCIIFMVLLVCPIFLFSEVNVFLIKPNPVLTAQLKVSLNINKTISEYEMTTGRILNLYPVRGQKNNLTDPFYDSSNFSSFHQSSHFNIYQVDEPYLRPFTSNMLKKSEYSKWTETKFFDYNRIQQCIGTEFGDEEWTINEYRIKQMDQDLRKAFSKDVYTMPENIRKYNVSLSIEYLFKRENPPEKKETKGDADRTLDVNYLEDCMTSKQLTELMNTNCDDPANINKTMNVVFYSALNSDLVLGATDKTYAIFRKGTPKAGQYYDIKLTYKCKKRQWLVHMSESKRDYKTNRYNRLVNPETPNCEFLKNITSNEKVNHNATKDREDLNSSKTKWERLHFTLFSMLAPTSFIAQYSPMTWYAVLVYGLGATFRGITIFATNTAFNYEMTSTDAIMKLIEGVYLKRHEEDLVGEEEYYRMVQEIMRSPELLKALTGTSLRGRLSPDLDQLNPKDRDKILHLEQMERKGYDVAKLKEKIIENKQMIGDINDGLDE